MKSRLQNGWRRSKAATLIRPICIQIRGNTNTRDLLALWDLLQGFVPWRIYMPINKPIVALVKLARGWGTV